MKHAAAPTLHAELVGIVKPYFVVSVQNRKGFTEATGASINTLLNVLYVLLLFVAIVAVVGIVALSVFERISEIRLLRCRRSEPSGSTF